MPVRIVRVVPAEQGWVLDREGFDQSPHLFPSLEAAIEAVWTCSKRENAELHILRHDGSVRIRSPLNGGRIDVEETNCNKAKNLGNFDETERAIARARKRIDAHEQRIKQLKGKGIDSQTAEMSLANIRDRLEKLHILRAIVMQAIAYRKHERTQAGWKDI